MAAVKHSRQLRPTAGKGLRIRKPAAKVMGIVLEAGTTS